MSPTFSRSSGNTTTVKGHVLWSWQKVRNVTPLVLSATCSTVPLTHWVVPTCLLASANETHSCLEDLEELRAEQTPLIVITAPRTLPSKQVRVRKRMVDQTQRNGIFSFIVGVKERSHAKAGGKFSRRLPEKGTCCAESRARTEVGVTGRSAGAKPRPATVLAITSTTPLLGERFYGRCFVVLHIEDGVELADLQLVVHFFCEVEQLEFA